MSTPRGQVLRDDDGMRLEFIRTYDAPIEDVWSAMTEPERIARWIGEVTGDPTTGIVQFLMSEDVDGDPSEVTIVACEPPHLLDIDIPTPDGSWPLSIRLAPHESGTTLIFTHRLAEPFDATSIGPGWHFYLDRLGSTIAGDSPDQVWDDYYPSLHDAYPLPGPQR
ncbi:MAG: SRPBCC family protein [Ornithinimicrobium sp.]